MVYCMTKPLIPFSWTPASWGLRGESRKLAEIEYNYRNDPHELERQKAYLANLDETALEMRLLEIDYNYGLMEEYDYLRRGIEIQVKDPTMQQMELIKLDIETGKIERPAGEKQIANLLGEPWVSVVNDNLDLTDGPNGFYFEFDWNENWIKMLRAHGYRGLTDEDVMEKWFTDVCRNEVISNTPQPINGGIVFE